MATQYLCLINKFGFCRYGNRHVMEICEKDACQDSECVQRHPRECRYWRDHSRCKFNEYCKFKHSFQSKPYRDLENELEKVKNKLKNLEEKLKEKDQQIIEIKMKIDEMSSLSASNRTRTSSITRLNPSSRNLNGIHQLSSDFSIPQIDGCGSEGLVTDSMKCENCHVLFGTSQLLDNHIEECEYVCDECCLCFKTEYNFDLHEHSEHREEYFKYNKVTPTTKMQRIKLLARNFP